jgi:hypothetical protein
VEAVGRDRVQRMSPIALQAYDLVLRAKALISKYTKTDNQEALACAERAVELDPTSARAHSLNAVRQLYLASLMISTKRAWASSIVMSLLAKNSVFRSSS